MKKEFYFKQNYSLEIIDYGYEKNDNIYYFQEKDNNNNALTLKFYTEKMSWIGIFDGSFSSNELIGVYSCPHEDYCLIVFSEIIYLINTIEPNKYNAFFLPKDLIISVKHNQIIMVLFNSLISIGSSGVIWELKNISIDSIALSDKSEKDLSIKYFDLQNDAYVNMTINFEHYTPVITRW